MNNNAVDTRLENEVIFDLVDSYKNKYKDRHQKITIEYFEHLVRKSKISVWHNQETNKKSKRPKAV